MTERGIPAMAPGALTPVAGKVEEVRGEAAMGRLRIDLPAAERLLEQIQQVRMRAGDLMRDGRKLDAPLRFGDNWIGQIMSERLRTVAVDKDGGVSPVLRQFHELLDAVEAVVRLAAGLYRSTDEQTASDLHRAAGRIGAQFGDLGPQIGTQP